METVRRGEETELGSAHAGPVPGDNGAIRVGTARVINQPDGSRICTETRIAPDTVHWTAW